MKKSLPKILISLVVLVIACMFFPLPVSTANAYSIENVSGNSIPLTGKVGKSPQHFFTDDAGNSTLINAKVVNDKVNDNYAISSQKKDYTSSGWGEFFPAVDMTPFIAQGLLYATISAEVTTTDDTEVVLSVSQGDNKVEFGTRASGKVETGLLKLEDEDTSIKFAFSASSTQNRTDFTISKPILHLYTKIDEVVLNTQDQIVTPGQLVNIDAYNAVTKLFDESEVSGDFLNYSKLKHEVQILFVQGGQYATVVGSNIVVSADAPEDAIIELYVYSNADTQTFNNIVKSESITLTVKMTNTVPVNVITDFENPAQILGVGDYERNTIAVLTVVPNTDFTFVGWYLDGKDEEHLVSNSRRYGFRVTEGMQIYAKFIKSVSISGIQISKVYDGTTEINPEVANIVYNFAGKEEQHNLALDNLTLAFEDVNASTDKKVEVSGTPVLVGADAEIYTLKSTAMPDIYGTILKRDVEVYFQDTQKEYGYGDPVFKCTPNQENLAPNETSLVGQPSREEGESLGQYAINLGDMQRLNPNYNIIVKNQAYLTISARTLTIDNLSVAEKVYDGSTTAQIEGRLSNIYNNEDVQVKIYGDFDSKNKGEDKLVTISKIELLGKDKDNYIVQNPTMELYGQITARPVEVSAIACEYTYGDEIILSYNISDLVENDEFLGELAIDNKNAGEHEILLNTLHNDNYQITNFISAICNIKKRPISVVAREQSIDYGDDYPELTYDVEGLLDGDSLTGKLSCVTEDSVGSYPITLGDLKNDNYIIEYTPATLIISERPITVEIQFLNKVYDANFLVEYTVNYKNNVKNENFVLNLTAQLASADCGMTDVVISNKSVQSDNLKNYKITFDIKNTQIEITQRNAYVYIDNTTKTYGENDDMVLSDVTNLVENQSLNLIISRQEGEDVAQYEIYVTDLSNNTNYNLVLVENYFEIIPKVLDVLLQDDSKVFGEKDPEVFEYEISGDFCFSDTKEKIITGKVVRQEGEDVGVYDYILDELSTSKNYTFNNVNNATFTIQAREVIVTLYSATKEYGEDDPVFEYSVEGEVPGAELSITISRDYYEDVGEYKLTCTPNGELRYIVKMSPESESAVLKITPAPISLKADNKFKVYGDADPKLTVSITNGLLKRGDQLDKISSNSLERDPGENVHEYAIKLGEFNLGKNYQITDFKEGTLTIIQRNLVIAAVSTSKVYGDTDPQLTYKIVEGELKNDDQITGELIREEGNDFGTYKILQGTLSVSDNYNLLYKPGNFKINKRQIEVFPTTLTKQYGDPEKPIEYYIDGELLDGDSLTGELYRDKMGVEQTGKYRIFSNLENQNYDIILNEYYFTITPRKIYIEAKSCEITYGENDPEFGYSIVSGEILEGDSIQGELTRVPGSVVGKYAIISSLKLGRNYTIVYTPGYLTIKPKEITLKTDNYTKTYGDIDPLFTYQIVEGELINDDVLYGSIGRKTGEDVGTYPLVKSVYNANYNITLIPADASLQIVKKEVKLISAVYNKIYDGTNVAYLKNPYISGAIDELSLSYNKDTCAEFATSEVGNNIPVTIHDILLVGEKSSNYTLVVPTNLCADITYDTMTNNHVSVTSSEAVLRENYNLNVNFQSYSKHLKIQNHKLVLKYNIYIDDSNDMVNLDSPYTIKIKLPEDVYLKNNIYVYYNMGDDKLLRLNSVKNDNGELVINSNLLGEFYITVEDETWVDYATIVSLTLFAIIIIGICVSIGVKYRKKSKK